MARGKRSRKAGKRNPISQYIVLVDGEERLRFEGNFTQASSPITIEGGGTPFQVADARHFPRRAVDLLYHWLKSEAGVPPWGEDEEYELTKVEEEAVKRRR